MHLFYLIFSMADEYFTVFYRGEGEAMANVVR